MLAHVDGWLDRLSLAQRFRMAIVTTVAAVAAIIGLQFWGMLELRKLQQRADAYASESLAAMTLEKDFTSLHRDALGYAAEPSDDTLQSLESNLVDFYASIEATRSLVVSEKSLRALNDIRSDTDDLAKILEAYIATVKAEGRASSQALATRGGEIDDAIESIRDTAIEALAAVKTAQADQSRNLMIISSAAALVFLGIIIVVNARVRSTITLTIAQVTDTLSAYASGLYDAKVAGEERTDEIGTLARSISVLRSNSIEALRLRSEQDQMRTAHTTKMLELADQLEARVGGLVSEMVLSAAQVEGSAARLQTIADTVAAEAQRVANGAQEAGQNVQTVASATEELAASIKEIAERASDVSVHGKRANDSATIAGERVATLDNAASSIGSVVGFITGIAEQTNLLALNATIEAARAGDAGRGFAVVASEVKSLAQQTASATENVASQVHTIQSSVKQAIEDISTVTGGISSLATVSTAIAGAISEQNAATEEITRAAQLAAGTTQEVSMRIVEVAHAADESRETSAQVKSSIQEMSARAKALLSDVQAFIGTLRKSA